MNWEISNKGDKVFLTVGFSLVAYSVYQLDKLKLKQLDFVHNASTDFETIQSLFQTYSDWYVKIFYLGLVITFIGVVFWIREFGPLDLTKKRFSNCQSCGEKFSGIKNYGNNSDKMPNYSFCDKCYTDGKFVNPEMTIEEILTEENKKNYNKNFSLLTFENYIRNLERWNSKKY